MLALLLFAVEPARLAGEESLVAFVALQAIEHWPAEWHHRSLLRAVRSTCRASPRLLAALGRSLRRERAGRNAASEVESLSPRSKVALMRGYLAGLDVPMDETLLPMGHTTHRLGPALRPLLPAFVRRLGAESPLVRAEAAYVLATSGNAKLRAKADAALADLIIRREEGRGMRHAPAIDEEMDRFPVSLPRTAAALIACLRSEDATDRMRAAYGLSCLPADADASAPVLERMLEEGKEVRFWEAEALLKIGRARKAVRYILDCVRRDEKNAWALLALRNAGPAGREALPVLARVVADRKHPRRAEAAYALARIAVPESDGERTRDARIDGLDALAEQRAAGETFNFPYWIGEIGPSAARLVPFLTRRVERSWGTMDALGAIGPEAAPAIPALLGQLRNGSRKERRPAAQALVRIRPDRRIVAAVLEAMRDEPDWWADFTTTVRGGDAVPLLRSRLVGRDAPLAAVLLWQLDPVAAEDAGAW